MGFFRQVKKGSGFSKGLILSHQFSFESLSLLLGVLEFSIETGSFLGHTAICIYAGVSPGFDLLNRESLFAGILGQIRLIAVYGG